MLNKDVFGPITQIGYLTDNIEAAAQAWTATSGIGPWTRMSGIKMAATMDGSPTEIIIDVALAYKGDVQIELIKPLSHTPSPYSDYQAAGLWGLHHLQFSTDDMAASLKHAEAAGLELACTIDQGGGIYNYLRGPGVWFELMEASEPLKGLFAMIKSAREDWDGTELIRDFGV